MSSMLIDHEEQRYARARDAIADTEWGPVRRGMLAVCRDGPAGRVGAVLRQPHTAAPTHLVVRRGWLNRRLIKIPLRWVIAIDGDRIMLNIRQWQLAHLPQHRSDVQIGWDVRLALATSDAFAVQGDAVALEVLVREGMVELRGNVRSLALKFAAQQIAHRIEGVQEVRNTLLVDDELRRRVLRALAADPLLERAALACDVDRGLVRLTGTVATAAQHARGLAVARSVAGLRVLDYAVEIGGAGDDGRPAQTGALSAGRAKAAGGA